MRHALPPIIASTPLGAGVATAAMIAKCLFPVAGYGTRFLPATRAVPKEMLPILDKPLIQYGVEEAAAAGIRHMAFVTARGKGAMEDHFDDVPDVERRVQGSVAEGRLDGIRALLDSCRFSWLRQRQMLGLGHAILCGQPLIGEEPFAAALPDDLCLHEPDGVLAQMTRVFERHGCSVVAVEEVPREATSRYGIVAGTEIDTDTLRVTDMVEKPAPDDAPSTLGIVGRYIFTPDIFGLIEATSPGAGGEIQITDALRRQAQEGRVVALRFRGHRFDCGTLDGFVAATNHCYALRRGDAAAAA